MKTLSIIAIICCSVFIIVFSYSVMFSEKSSAFVMLFAALSAIAELIYSIKIYKIVKAAKIRESSEAMDSDIFLSIGANDFTMIYRIICWVNSIIFLFMAITLSLTFNQLSGDPIRQSSAFRENETLFHVTFLFPFVLYLFLLVFNLKSFVWAKNVEVGEGEIR